MTGGRALVREEYVASAADDAPGLVGLLADEPRLRAFAAVVLGAQARRTCRSNGTPDSKRFVR
jgi:hypothetical protein